MCALLCLHVCVTHGVLSWLNPVSRWQGQAARPRCVGTGVSRPFVCEPGLHTSQEEPPLFPAVSLRKGHFALVSLPVVLVPLTGGVPASALICKPRTPQGAQTLLVNVYLYHACLDKEGAGRTRVANTPFWAIVFSTEDCRKEHLPSVLLFQ